MKFKSKTSFIGGIVAIIIATTCCWFPFLLVSIGAGAGLVGFSEGLQNYSNLLMGLGAVLILYGGYQYYKRAHRKPSENVNLNSTIVCPNCSHSKHEIMPTNACQYFYECENCHEILKPVQGDCCVYCSYGDVDCPPMQTGNECC